MHEHVACHTMAAQAAKCRGVAVHNKWYKRRRFNIETPVLQMLLRGRVSLNITGCNVSFSCTQVVPIEITFLVKTVFLKCIGISSQNYKDFIVSSDLLLFHCPKFSVLSLNRSNAFISRCTTALCDLLHLH